jgi:hypothetical protein
MFVINPTKLKKQTLALLALLAAGSFGIQAEWVQQHITPLVLRHPHWTFLVPSIMGGLALIHNPVAQKIAKQVFVDETTTNQDGSQTTTTVEATTKTTPPVA